MKITRWLKFQQIRRNFSEINVVNNLQELTEQHGPQIFISKLLNPYLNLALETYIFENIPQFDSSHTNNNRLFFYKNSKCIVFGKNQNPWKEINFGHLNRLSEKVEVLRRYSGGGTVIHDQGNVNYSYMTSKNAFDRKYFSGMIVDAVNATDRGISGSPRYTIKVNERGDLVALTSDGECKISGSAYKVSRGKSYHHGTMLLNSDLRDFSGLLGHLDARYTIVDNSVDSKKAKVINLEMDEQLFMAALIRQFAASQVRHVGQINVISSSTRLPRKVLASANELQSWEFKFGKTPKFKTIINQEITILVEKGYVQDVTWEDSVAEKTQEELTSLTKMTEIPYKVSLGEYFTDPNLKHWAENLLD